MERRTMTALTCGGGNRCTQEKRTFLRQRIQARLTSIYLLTSKVSDGLLHRTPQGRGSASSCLWTERRGKTSGLLFLMTVQRRFGVDHSHTQRCVALPFGPCACITHHTLSLSLACVMQR
jgi:hypothetical protein